MKRGNTDFFVSSIGNDKDKIKVLSLIEAYVVDFEIYDSNGSTHFAYIRGYLPEQGNNSYYFIDIDLSTNENVTIPIVQ